MLHLTYIVHLRIIYFIVYVLLFFFYFNNIITYIYINVYLISTTQTDIGVADIQKNEASFCPY